MILTPQRDIQSDPGYLDILAEIGCLATRSLDVEEALPRTLAAIAAAVPADRIVTLVPGGESTEVLGHWARADTTTVVEWQRLQGVSLQVGGKDARYILADESAAKLGMLPYLASRHARIDALCVPLTADHAIVGRLDIIRAGEGSTFSTMEQQLAQASARILGLAIRNSSEYARVAWLAEHDPLTGIGNRRRFDTALARELTRAERYGRNLSLLLIDLDDFKEVNSNLGLSGGDETLRRTAQTLAKGARKGVDVPCRIGGDEFAMILPEIDERAANDLAQRLLTEVQRATVSLWPVQFSYSISTFPDISGDSLRGNADSRLLDAKHRKERVAFAVRVQ